MRIRPGLISLFNIFIVLILIILSLIGYTNSLNAQEIIRNNKEHNLTYLQAKSLANGFINDLETSGLEELGNEYQFDIDGFVITYDIELDYQQYLRLVYNYQTHEILREILINESDYQVDDTIPVFKGD